MRFKAYFNRDGGTFRTIDMAAYAQKAEQVFRDAGHEIECHVVAGKEMVKAIEKGAAEKGTEHDLAAAGAVAQRIGDQGHRFHRRVQGQEVAFGAAAAERVDPGIAPPVAPELDVVPARAH